MPLAAAHAAAAEVLAGDCPAAACPSSIFDSAISSGQFPLSALARAVQDDLQAARAAEQRQDHRRWMNPRHQLSLSGVDVLAIANVIIAYDAALLERHIGHLVGTARPTDRPLDF